MVDIVQASEVDLSAADAAALIGSFVRSWHLGRLLRSHAASQRRWLCVISGERERELFERLAHNSNELVLFCPKEPQLFEATAPIHRAIAVNPPRYEFWVRLILRLYRAKLTGVIVGCDLLPWVRHLVYSCKPLRIPTYLLPKLSLPPQPSGLDPNPGKGGSILDAEPQRRPSVYSMPGVVADSPVTDRVLVVSAQERNALVDLGYPEERVFCLGNTSDSFTAQLEARALSQEPPFDPSRVEELFTDRLEPRPYSGLVAYHREVESASAYVPAMLGHRGFFAPNTFAEAQNADLFATWGGLGSGERKKRIRSWAARLSRPYVMLEDGLFRSIEIGLSGAPTVSIMLDDLRAYYDATRPSRLELLLNSRTSFSDAARLRARRCIAAIAQHRLSKYNHAPDAPVPFGPDAVLVVDQRRRDLSVEKGLANERSFRRMLLTARRENPESQVLIKRHPDALSGGKTSYFSDESLAELGTLPNVHLLDFEVNPHALFDCCKKVYVVTSGMGFEALMRGLPVCCFGMPFYAGWGITSDKRSLWRRRRKRTLEEVFFAACILHSRYYDPVAERPCDLERVIAYLAQARDAKQAPATRDWDGQAP